MNALFHSARILLACMMLSSLTVGAAEHCWQDHGCTRLTGVGHGVAPADEGMPFAQRQLMAIRAARIDALRSLAEQARGLHLNAASSVNSAVLNLDLTQISINTTLRGVRYIRVEAVQPGIYEATAELDIYQ